MNPIQRKSNLSAVEFERDHLQDDGHPVILTDATSAWSAHVNWTFESLKKKYGSDLVTVYSGIGSKLGKLTRLAAFIDHLDDSTFEFPGFWINSKGDPIPKPSEIPTNVPYLLEWCAFQRHPELYQNITPSISSIADWSLGLSTTLRSLAESAANREFWSIYIGPSKTLSRLHQDFWRTHACLTQIKGSKLFQLFHPTDSPYLYAGLVDPLLPDYEKYPLLRNATAFECVLKPGETIFIPPDWWHHAISLENQLLYRTIFSITQTTTTILTFYQSAIQL